MSDARGRRVPLLLSLIVLTAASLACAFSPSITVMMAARFVQGLSGGWAMVTARAIIIDLSRGPQLVRRLNLIAGIGGIAPIIGPLMGAVILQLSNWRVSFWVVAALGALMIAAVLVGVPESLPADRRHQGGLSKLGKTAGHVIGNRGFVGYLIVMSFSMGITFAYVATSAFIMQSMNGLSPVVYSVDFAANAVGLALATLLAARLAGRVPTRHVITVGLLVTGAAGLLLLVGALWWETPLVVAVVAFFLLMSAQGLVGPNAGALASAQVPEHPGTGSAILGFLQWTMAGVVAPIAGLGGEHTAVPMALIILVLAGASTAALFGLTRGEPRPQDQIMRSAPLGTR